MKQAVLIRGGRWPAEMVARAGEKGSYLVVAEGSDEGAQLELATLEAMPHEGGASVVKIIGELDISSVESVRAALEPIVQREPSTIVFDLSELRFMDSSGLALLVTVVEQVGVVEIRNPLPIIRRIIEVTGLSSVLRMNT